MSLSKLNDQLKADICSFLDFKDINKLAQVNRGIKASLHRRGLDKPKVHSLGFEWHRGTDKLGCFVELHREDDMSHKVAEIELENRVLKSTEVWNWINKFNAIEVLKLNYIRLQDNAGWEDIAAKIRSVDLFKSDIKMSKEAVMKFFEKFEEVTIDECIMNPAYITDEFHIELARVGTTVHYQGDINQVVDVTDASLDVLSSRRIPEKLFLEGLITGITFARVKKMIEDALKSEMTDIDYNFGYLKSDQYNAVNSFISEEFERWAEPLYPYLLRLYPRNYQNCKVYTITNYSTMDIQFKFSMYKQEEVNLENENVGEEQEGGPRDG